MTGAITGSLPCDGPSRLRAGAGQKNDTPQAACPGATGADYESSATARQSERPRIGQARVSAPPAVAAAVGCT